MLLLQCMNINTGNGSDMLTEAQSKHFWVICNWVHYGSFQNGTNMSLSTDILNGIVDYWDVGHFRMSLVCSLNQPESWCAAWEQQFLCIYMELQCSLTFYIPVLASSWGKKLDAFFQKCVYGMHLFHKAQKVATTICFVYAKLQLMH